MAGIPASLKFFGLSFRSFISCVFNGDDLLSVYFFILLHEKFLQFYWLRAVVFQRNLKYLHVKITNLLQVVV